MDYQIEFSVRCGKNIDIKQIQTDLDHGVLNKGVEILFAYRSGLPDDINFLSLKENGSTNIVITDSFESLLKVVAFIKKFVKDHSEGCVENSFCVTVHELSVSGIESIEMLNRICKYLEKKIPHNHLVSYSLKNPLFSTKMTLLAFVYALIIIFSIFIIKIYITGEF